VTEPRSTGPRRAPDGAADQRGATVEGLWRLGRTGWAVLGIVGVAIVLGYLFSALTLVIIPFVLALFPATLLVPVANWLKDHGVPAALAAIISIVGGIAVIAAVIGAMVPLVIAELPTLTRSASEGLGQIEDFVREESPLGIEVDGFGALLDELQDQLPEIGELAGQAFGAAVVAFEFVAGLLLMLVTLFFFLKDGRRLSDGVIATAPPRSRPRLAGIADRAWDTIGSYFRGQLLVALVDAVFIGLGLLILGVPLAIPLAVLIFFGGLFPIVGAVTTGTLAVLVALADQGLTSALIVLGLVLLVQQLESNVLEPLILGHVIRLHPLVILIAITAGAVSLGILGAFLAVPVAATVARIVDYVREDQPEGAKDPADDQPPPKQPAEET
jgi:putative heme transporter